MSRLTRCHKVVDPVTRSDTQYQLYYTGQVVQLLASYQEE